VITKLPRWVEYGAFLLSLLAGSVNAIGLMSFQHQAVSHLSGTVTLFAANIAQQGNQSLHLMFVILSFLLGSMAAGVFIEGTALKQGRRYGVALCIEGLLLIAAYWLLKSGHVYGQYLASAACGLQNAMITTFSGAVVRTTHMTGIITDLGLMMGAYIRGERFDFRKAKLFIIILLGFLSGGYLGATLFNQYQFDALGLPIALTFALALIYWLLIFKTKTHTPP
jgi:uncharacterized membrane protein YoaK (UPF0700 family)